MIAAVDIWELFPATYILGSKELDRYIRVPAPAVAAVRHAVSLFNGQRTLIELEREMELAGWRIDVRRLSRQVARAGLLVGVPHVSDLDSLSVTWGELRLMRDEPRPEHWRPFVRTLLVCAAASCVAALVMLPKRGWLFGSPIVHLPAWLEVPAIAFGVLVSLLVHEGAHLSVAASCGLASRGMRLLGYWGVIPFAVLRIPGIYTLPPGQRLSIWVAGPVASLALSCTCYVVQGMSLWEPAIRVWLGYMAQINFMVALWNCCPLLPTDGYFIASTLLRQANWRARSWSALNLRVGREHRPNLLLLAYGVVSLLALALLFLRSCLRILHWTEAVPVLGYLAIAALVSVLLRKRALHRRRMLQQFWEAEGA